jgi:hypothetical protein
VLSPSSCCPRLLHGVPCLRVAPFPLCCLDLSRVVCGGWGSAVVSVDSGPLCCAVCFSGVLSAVVSHGVTCGVVSWGSGGVMDSSGLFRCGTVSRYSFPPFVFTVTALLVWGGVLVSGLCYCGMAVVQWGGGVLVHCSRSLSSLSSLVLVFGVVRAQPCEHARYPRTPLRPLVVFSFLVAARLLCSSPFFTIRLSSACSEWRRGVHHVSLCCVGMTAMGSLSLSSSFFW